MSTDYYEKHIAPLRRKLEEGIDLAPVSLSEALEMAKRAREELSERVLCLEEDVAREGEGFFDDGD